MEISHLETCAGKYLSFSHVCYAYYKHGFVRTCVYGYCVGTGFRTSWSCASTRSHTQLQMSIACFPSLMEIMSLSGFWGGATTTNPWEVRLIVVEGMYWCGWVYWDYLLYRVGMHWRWMRIMSAESPHVSVCVQQNGSVCGWTVQQIQLSFIFEKII